MAASINTTPPLPVVVNAGLPEDGRLTDDVQIGFYVQRLHPDSLRLPSLHRKLCPLISRNEHSEGQSSDQLNVAQRSVAPRLVFVARRGRYARMQRCIACGCSAAQLARLSLRQLR
ncbi:hypothetical protein PCAR4_390096 [Paraburkholderia caribensis]|nr:hypothetical protein PCAR4_390096 [Paraburkholderia caribensis]